MKMMKAKCRSVDLNRNLYLINYDFRSLETSAAKPDPFFRVEPDFGPDIWVESGRICPQGQNMGPIVSGWPQIGFKFGFNRKTQMNPISGREGIGM